MDGLADYLPERFAKVTDATSLLFLSHAEDANRAREDTHSGRIIAWLEENLDAVDVPLYGRMPHNEQGQLGVHTAAETRQAAEALTPDALQTILRFLASGRCIFLGDEPGKLLRAPLGTFAVASAVKLPHPELWGRTRRGTCVLEDVVKALQPLHASATKENLEGIVRETHRTPKRQEASAETGSLVGKLIHPPASEKQRRHCSELGKRSGGPRRATPESRAASSATGRLMGTLKPTAGGRRKCAETAISSMRTEEGQQRQKAKAEHMNAVKDAEASKKACKEGQQKYHSTESNFGHFDETTLRSQLAEGVSLAELCHQYMVHERHLRGWIRDTLKIPLSDVTQKSYGEPLSSDADAMALARKLHALGFQPSRIACLLPLPVSMRDVAELVGVTDPNHATDGAPAKNTKEGEWLSEADLHYLLRLIPVERLARSLRTISSKGGYLLLWMRFLEDFRDGKVQTNANPDRLPHKTAKKANADLHAGIDRDTLNAEHNARVMQEQRETTAAASKLKRERRSAEDAAARDALKRRRTSAKGKRLTASGGALAPPESHATEGRVRKRMPPPLLRERWKAQE